MREIKYKAWDKLLKEMNFVCKIDFCNVGDFGSASVSVLMKNGSIVRTSRMEDVILLQFTGLLDKSGKEIYEGDIVKLSLIKLTNNAPVTAVVQYKAPTFISVSDTYAEMLYGGEEIVGNVHENPELLGEK